MSDSKRQAADDAKEKEKNYTDLLKQTAARRAHRQQQQASIPTQPTQPQSARASIVTSPPVTQTPVRQRSLTPPPMYSPPRTAETDAAEQIESDARLAAQLQHEFEAAEDATVLADERLARQMAQDEKEHGDEDDDDDDDVVVASPPGQTPAPRPSYQDTLISQDDSMMPIQQPPRRQSQMQQHTMSLPFFPGVQFTFSSGTSKLQRRSERSNATSSTAAYNSRRWAEEVACIQ